MCGIAGYIGRRGLSEKQVGRTLDLMKNRGPDDQRHRLVASGRIRVDLLHSRLSIIDLDERSNQPFKIGPATLIFNGEIYNYVELRHELIEQGIKFITESDTEVLLRSYLEWGDACVEKFEGMWALAVWDERYNRLWLSRDRFAEKPLYYWPADDGMYFASETKYFRSMADRTLKVNQDQLLRYLVNGYKSLVSFYLRLAILILSPSTNPRPPGQTIRHTGAYTDTHKSFAYQTFFSALAHSTIVSHIP